MPAKERRLTADAAASAAHESGVSEPDMAE
jgi:hypothetical protein